MKTETVLRKAAEIILTPGQWTQGYYARNSDGRAVFSHAPTAESFCALGAVYRAGRNATCGIWTSTRAAINGWTDSLAALNDNLATTAEDMGTFLLFVAEAEKTGSRPE